MRKALVVSGFIVLLMTAFTCVYVVEAASKTAADLRPMIIKLSAADVWDNVVASAIAVLTPQQRQDLLDNFLIRVEMDNIPEEVPNAYLRHRRVVEGFNQTEGAFDPVALKAFLDDPDSYAPEPEE